MWTVVYMAQSKDNATKLQDLLTKEGILVKIRPLSKKNTGCCYQVNFQKDDNGIAAFKENLEKEGIEFNEIKKDDDRIFLEVMVEEPEKINISRLKELIAASGAGYEMIETSCSSDSYYEVLVPEAEVEDAHSVIIEKGF
jgi:hypothetical protein